MQAKLLGYEPKQRTLKPEALPTILNNKVFSIVNINYETAAYGVRSCKQIQINKQHGVQFIYHSKGPSTNNFVTLSGFCLLSKNPFTPCS